MAQLAADRVVMVEATLQCLGAEHSYFKQVAVAVAVAPKVLARGMVEMAVRAEAPVVLRVQMAAAQVADVAGHRVLLQLEAQAVLQVQMALQVQQA